MKVSIKSFLIFSFLVGFFVVMDVRALSKNKKAAFCSLSGGALGALSIRTNSVLFLIRLYGGFNSSPALVSINGKGFKLPWSMKTHVKGVRNITGVGAAFLVFKGFEFMFRKKEEIV